MLSYGGYLVNWSRYSGNKTKFLIMWLCYCIEQRRPQDQSPSQSQGLLSGIAAISVRSQQPQPGTVVSVGAPAQIQETATGARVEIEGPITEVDVIHTLATMSGVNGRESGIAENTILLEALAEAGAAAGEEEDRGHVQGPLICAGLNILFLGTEVLTISDWLLESSLRTCIAES